MSYPGRESSMPLIRLEVEGMRRSMLVALTEEFAARDEDIKTALDQVISSYPWRAKLIQDATFALEAEIKKLADSVAREVLQDPQLRHQIQTELVAGMLTNIKKIYWQHEDEGA